MKFFHLSDLHIGLKLYNRDLTEDQAHIFRQIIQAARREQPDAVVIAGDIYDRAVPSGEAVALFDRFYPSCIRPFLRGKFWSSAATTTALPGSTCSAACCSISTST